MTLELLALGLALGAVQPRQDAALERVERQVARLAGAYRDGDAGAIRSLVTGDHVAIATYYGGPLTLDEELALRRDAEVTEYTPGELEATRLGDGVVQVTYTATRAGTFRGEAIAAEIFASSIWVRRDGRWRERFYQETRLDD